MISPALHRCPDKAAMIGLLVVGYGELDIAMVDAAGTAIGLRFPLLDAVEAVNSEVTRIEVIKRMTQKHFAHVGIEEQFLHAIDAQGFCREVRNYYAHCHYADFENSTILATVKAKDLFSDQSMTVQKMPWRQVPKDLLLAQEAYFVHTRMWWLWLQHAVGTLVKGHQPELNEPPKPPKPEKLGPPYVPT